MSQSLNRIDRANSGSRFYLPQLDGLRFFAFLLVFVSHHGLLQSTRFRILREEGWIGVDLFFALSAFLFTNLLTQEQRQAGGISFRWFYLRRVLRLWPAYFAYVGICLLVTLLVGHLDHGTLGIRALGLVTFTDNLFAARGGFNPILFTPHLWSICYEVQYYLAIPPAIWIFSKLNHNLRGIGMVLLVCVGWSTKAWLIASGDAHLAVWTLPLAHFESIALGCLVAYSADKRTFQHLPGGVAFGIGTSCFVLQCLLPSADISSIALFPKYLLSGLASAFWIQSALTSPRLSAGLAHPWLVHLGKRSYGLYLYHLGSIVVVAMILKRIPGKLSPDGPISFLLSLLVTWVAAYLSYRWLESPFLRRKKHFEVVDSRPI